MGVAFIHLLAPGAFSLLGVMVQFPNLRKNILPRKRKCAPELKCSRRPARKNEFGIGNIFGESSKPRCVGGSGRACGLDFHRNGAPGWSPYDTIDLGAAIGAEKRDIQIEAQVVVYGFDFADK